jgi:hypothetical protein
MRTLLNRFRGSRKPAETLRPPDATITAKVFMRGNNQHGDTDLYLDGRNIGHVRFRLDRTDETIEIFNVQQISIANTSDRRKGFATMLVLMTHSVLAPNAEVRLCGGFSENGQAWATEMQKRHDWQW